MRLRKAQREAVLKWIVEGLQSDEINSRAATFEDPFQVSRAVVDYYRKTREVEIGALIKAGQEDALNEGLALVAERVKKLKQIAALMERDLFGGFLWTEETKGVGSGEAAEVIDYDVFNSAEVVQYRGVLDDIAKETGGRVQKTDLTSKGEAIQFVNVGVDIEKL